MYTNSIDSAYLLLKWVRPSIVELLPWILKILIVATCIPCGIVHQTLEACRAEPLRPREGQQKSNGDGYVLNNAV